VIGDRKFQLSDGKLVDSASGEEMHGQPTLRFTADNRPEIVTSEGWTYRADATTVEPASVPVTEAVPGAAPPDTIATPAAEGVPKVVTDVTPEPSRSAAVPLAATTVAAIAAAITALEAPATTSPVPTPQTPADAPPVLSDALIKLATVQNWEGPYHSADRILRGILGRTPTLDEVRALTGALQEEFKAEHDGRSITDVGLVRGYQFLTAQNLQSVLNQLQGSPELQAKLKAFVVAGSPVPANIPSQRAFPAHAQVPHHASYR